VLEAPEVLEVAREFADAGGVVDSLVVAEQLEARLVVVC